MRREYSAGRAFLADAGELVGVFRFYGVSPPALLPGVVAAVSRVRIGSGRKPLPGHPSGRPSPRVRPNENRYTHNDDAPHEDSQLLTSCHVVSFVASSPVWRRLNR